jgi:hypothetical protein
MRRTQLEAVYRRAIYRLLEGGSEVRAPIDLLVDGRSAELDRLLARHGATSWAFVSAANPGSKRLSAAENRRRTHRLAAAIARRGWTRYRGTGIDPSGGWPEEPSYLVLDAPLEEVAALAARFGQAAIVHGTAGGRARLRWIESSPRSRSSAGVRAPR